MFTASLLSNFAKRHVMLTKLAHDVVKQRVHSVRCRYRRRVDSSLLILSP